ncbi:SDR family oxidoreductase [Leeuwenhoekiella marinoflava]|uniref:NAD(P)-dependent dehydrogenase (Short-subunit alcohol dehydrogenase family) n=2 Tax=Leeuwenhoekiella marinoflava TaxID=988 RepID=A0A4Q0PMF7_9FLAO|nr:SDR family oxidoreductase [Leeuwenhoekiella marinoflava]RXG31696.1 NAD(P)-dependent dehydrogenase (short-subunit alcohol dehydrogenase family) [Leeuwenhoekiella marinoflava]SHF08341.1 NAD(P)-dependent dehydrogenase, short-chain alcohol dehydrogenase family [Leeuwenhoekiella marinoflava DSM 3653]
MNFENKNVIITGGSSGIGFAKAKAFIEKGANVWITGRSAENLQKAAAKIDSRRLNTVVSDTSNLAGIAVLEKIVTESGIKIDVLFLNAGTAIFNSIEQVTEADFDVQFNTNVKGSFFTLQKLLPNIKNGGALLFTSSTSATAANLGASVYSATKGALSKIAQIAANELADRNIRVNIVSPGPVQTKILDSAVPTKEAKDYVASATALKRVGNPDEIAKAVLFLASEEASFVVGTELLVDGGYTNYARK